jgi:hypothetical protein
VTRRRISGITALSVAVVALGLTAGPARGDQTWPPPQPPTGSNSDSGDINIWVSFDETKNYHNDVGPGRQVTVSGDWTPPLCWWEPKYTPQQFADYINSWAKPGDTVYGIYHDGHPYTNFNIGKNGMWWQTFQNFGPDTFWKEVDDCGYALLGTANPAGQPWTWADTGHVPPGGGTLTGEDLGKLALNHLRVPPIEASDVGLAPAPDKQVVNLSTWLWLNQAVFHPLSVTASLKAPMPPLSATATATPASLNIDPGDTNAKVFTSGCGADNAGLIGQKWIGQPGDPGCGIVYRSPGPHTITLKLVWNVTWTSNDPAYPGGTVPGPVTSQGTVGVTVNEVETVNN